MSGIFYLPMSSVKATNPRTPRGSSCHTPSRAPTPGQEGACDFFRVGSAGPGLRGAVFSRPVEKVTEQERFPGRSCFFQPNRQYTFNTIFSPFLCRLRVFQSEKDLRDEMVQCLTLHLVLQPGTLRARVGTWPCGWQRELNVLLHGSLTQLEFVAKIRRNVSQSLAVVRTHY